MTDPNRPTVTGYPAPPPTSNGYPAPPPTSNGYPAATAYPYPAQHHQPSYFNISSNNNNNYYSNPIHQQRVTFLRRIFAIVIACVILIGTIAFIMWLILRPQLPQFTLQTLTLTNFNLTSNTISANWNAQFLIRNPNSKITLHYDRVESAVFYKSESVSETSLPPFVQGKKNDTVVKAAFAALSAYVDDWDGISKEKGSGKVGFNLRLVARVRFRAGDWWARRRILRVYCPDCFVGVSGNGSNSGGALTGGSKQCRVGL